LGALPRPAGFRLPADAEIDLAFDDGERFVPGMAVRRRTTALGPTLQEDLVAFGGFARCEHGDVLADDVESGRVVLGFDNELFHSHPEFPSLRHVPGTPLPHTVTASRTGLWPSTCVHSMHAESSRSDGASAATPRTASSIVVRARAAPRQ